MNSPKRKFLKRRKAHPDQAGLIRRGFALGSDTIMILIISFVIYAGGSEIIGWMGGEPGIFSRIIHAKKEGRSVIVTFSVGKPGEETEEGTSEGTHLTYLTILEEQLSPQEYEKAREMEVYELEVAYYEELDAGREEREIISLQEEGFSLLQELIVGYLYFVLLFRFGGRTIGKRIFGLKVIDLKGKKHLGWYQAFERTHGYAASALFSTLGYWQVLWDAEGLTMHDKIAGTTVVRVRGRAKQPKMK